MDFTPHPFLLNAHLMTMVPGFLPRNHSAKLVNGKQSIFQVADEAQIVAFCHIDTSKPDAPTLLIVHGLEGSAESPYMLGLTGKAISAGMNVVRMNMRNCGGTEHLSKGLYNAGLSCDVIAVARELKQKFALEHIFAAGFSLGGNMVLKAAAELSLDGDLLFDGICAVSPSIDLHASVDSLSRGLNRVYELRFLNGLIAKIREKSRIFPGSFDTSHIKNIKTIRQFDDIYTAPDGGYGNADNYYTTASAIHRLNDIRIPTLIITSQDDPIVPYSSFVSNRFHNVNIELVAPKFGGHGGFFSRNLENFVDNAEGDRFWAEHKIVSFCLAKYHSSENKPNV